MLQLSKLVLGKTQNLISEKKKTKQFGYIKFDWKLREKNQKNATKYFRLLNVIGNINFTKRLSYVACNGN